MTNLPGDHDEVTMTAQEEALHRKRRKKAKELMGNKETRRMDAADQFESDGDPLPAKGEPIARYLHVTRLDTYHWYSFIDKPEDAGLYDITSDGDGYTEAVIDLDTGDSLQIDVARGFYVQRLSASTTEYGFPQPDKGFVRVFFYVDIPPADLPALRTGADLTNDKLGPLTIGWLAGVQRNIDDDS